MGKREHEVLIIISLIFISILLGNYVLLPLLGASNYSYYFKPLFWAALSFYIWKQPRIKFKGKLKLYKYLLLWSAICGIIYISIYFSVGFIDGIGASPYAKDIKGILLNVLCFGSVMAMMEWVRSYLINRVKKKYIIAFGILLVFVFTLYRLNIRAISGLTSLQQVVQYFGEYIFPEIISNIFLTYLVYICGAFPAIIYIVITTIPIWIAPVLPNLTWISRAFVGVLTPVIFTLVIRQIYKKQTNEIKIRDQKKENPYKWIATSVFAIVIIWFSVGVFPIFPTVILTGSMEPYIYPGDVAIMQKSDGSGIKVGNVVQYWTGEIFIIHRVISIDPETGNFKTKGDNNSAPDLALVTKHQIKGKLVTVIPKVGILSTVFNKSHVPKEKVEF